MILASLLAAILLNPSGNTDYKLATLLQDNNYTMTTLDEVDPTMHSNRSKLQKSLTIRKKDERKVKTAENEKGQNQTVLSKEEYDLTEVPLVS